MSSIINAGTSGVTITGSTSTVLSLATNGTTRLNIDASGNLAVGTGNLTFSSTGQRITGDMSNATIANRLAFQSSVTNGTTSLIVIPNGTATGAQLNLETDSAIANGVSFQFIASPTLGDTRIQSGIRGTGSYLPMTFYTGGSERMRLSTTGEFAVGFGGNSGQGIFQVARTISGGGPATSGTTDANQVMAFNASSVQLGYGAYANGTGWIQQRATANYATNYDLVLQPNGGNVGIGTASPGFLFDTFNSSTATDYIAGRFYSNAAAAGESRTWLKVEKAANYGGAIGGYLSQGVGSGLIFGTQNNASTPTERMRIDNNGNVGIGTASPTNKFQVSGDGARSVSQAATNTGYAEVEAQVYNYWGGTGGPTYTGTAIAQWGAGATGTSAGIARANLGELRFQNGSGGLIYTNGATPLVFATTSTERMRINSSGNVGIGTASPGTKLHLYGAGTTSTSYTNGDAAGATLYLQDSGASSGNGGQLLFGSFFGASAGIKSFVTDGTGPAGNLIFQTRSTSGNILERMRITSGGNVGINGDPGTDWRFYVAGETTTSAKNAIVIRNSGNNNLFYIRNDGAINTGLQATSPYNLTTAGAADAVLGADGFLYRSTSSLRYKTDVTDAAHGLADVLKLRSVIYKGINDGDKIFGGLIAEEVHDAGLTEFVKYDSEGRPDALAYSNMVALLVKAIQELSAKVAALEAK